MTPPEMEVHYRHVPTLEKNYAISAMFRGVPRGKDEIMHKLEESQHKRKASQPAASSAGCIFKNPENIPAGKLVDELGLKNCAIGKARVSEVHGNFIVNDGGATAAEMLELIAKIQATTREKRGVELQTEVQIVGEEG
jgi:UDP-N-acetylmuramate--alanine ligase